MLCPSSFVPMSAVEVVDVDVGSLSEYLQLGDGDVEGPPKNGGVKRGQSQS